MCGKTTMVLEPLIAQDFKKKHFFQEISKELGFTALKTGIATLNRPYDAEFLNQNFHLSMLVPRVGKEAVYKAYVRKMIFNTTADNQLIYRNLGVSVLSPDPEHIDRVKELADNFNIPITVLDAVDSNAPGLNPFAIPAPHVCAAVINQTFATLYSGAQDPWDAYVTNTAHRAIQNVVVLLHVMYPRLNNGTLPNLEDLSKCLTDFKYTEHLCEELKKVPELVEKYPFLITYMEQNFYDVSGEDREVTKKLVHFIITNVDFLLNIGAARQILCNRTNNLKYREILTNGGVVAVCSRYADCGGAFSKVLAHFFMNAVIFGMEDYPSLETKLPHFLYFDAFDQYATNQSTDFFTQGRKFKVGITITSHTLAGIGGVTSSFGQTVSANSPTKLTFGAANQEDYTWWEKEFCYRREWDISNNYNSDEEAFSSNLGQVKWTWKDTMHIGKIQGLGHKEVIYKYRDKSGKHKVGFGLVDNVPSKYLAKQKSKRYNFGKYCLARPQKEAVEKDPRFDPKEADFEDHGADVDPIYMNTTDSNVFFNNDDAISFNIPRKK